MAAGTGILAGRVLEGAARHGWQSLTGDEPPAHPESPETAWREALLGTAATSLTLGVGRLLSQRLAAAGWQRLAGRRPPIRGG